MPGIDDPVPRGRRKCYPRSSCGVFVFVDDASEAIMSTDDEVRDLVWIGERFRQWMEWSGVGDCSVWPVFVVATRSRTL